MARKNNVKSEQPGSILFDTRTRAVMAGPDSNDNIKEKVQSVREVVPGKSNNEIVLVLQYYDYSVEKAIQAYLEDNAKEALGEWHVPPSKPNKKKKNKKKAGQAENSPGETSASVHSSSSQSSVQRVPTANNGTSSILIGSSKTALPNGDVYTGSIKGLEVTNSALLEGAASGLSPPISSDSISVSLSQNKHHNYSTHSGSQSHGHHTHGHVQSTRTTSDRSSTSSVGAGGDNHSRRPFQGLEKSIKDLQRQTTSLERLRLLLDHEIERSYKSIRTVFDEMRTHVNTREKEVLAEMDVVRKQAYEVFKMRQEKAAELKVHIERAEKLTESEIGDLRANVKHFVADRKVDEDLGKTTRFLYDSDHLKKEIFSFGEVLQVKCTYTTRRPSVSSSVASSSQGTEDVHSPLTVQPNAMDMLADTRNSSQLEDSNQMTTEELASLHMRLQNSLKIQGFDHTRQFSANGSNSTAGIDDYNQKTKSVRRRNRPREQQEQQKNAEESLVTPTPVSQSLANSRAATPSSTQASVGSPSPSPQRVQISSQRGGSYRGRGRGGPGSGYRGGQNYGRGNPGRQYSSGGGRGGGFGGGGDQNRNRPVAVNGGRS